jgi:hypothetical protein
MKTIRQWLETLPEPYRSAAIRNAENDVPTTIEEQCDSLSEALSNSAYWSKTPEGHDYWGELYDRLCHEEAVTPKSKEQQIAELKANIAKMQSELDKLEKE